MANKERGEISIEIEGKTYTLFLGLNAMALLEDYFSTEKRQVTFDECVERLNAGSIRHIRAFFWAALQAYHPNVTVFDAGNLIQRGGGLEAFGNKLMKLTSTSVQPDPEDLQALGVDPKGNPRKGRGKRPARGGPSTSTAVS